MKRKTQSRSAWGEQLLAQSSVANSAPRNQPVSAASSEMVFMMAEALTQAITLPKLCGAMHLKTPRPQERRCTSITFASLSQSRVIHPGANSRPRIVHTDHLEPRNRGLGKTARRCGHRRAATRSTHASWKSAQVRRQELATQRIRLSSCQGASNRVIIRTSRHCKVRHFAPATGEAFWGGQRGIAGPLHETTPSVWSVAAPRRRKRSAACCINSPLTGYKSKWNDMLL
jgi:hypothetical protein